MNDVVKRKLIAEIADSEWQNPDSVTSKNLAMYGNLFRRAFVLAADLGGLCIVMPDGRVYTLLHRSGTLKSFQPEAENLERMTKRILAERFPKLVGYVSFE